MKKLLIALILIPAFAPILFARTTKHTLEISPPRIEEINGYHRVTLDKALVTGEVSDPQLPVWGLNLLLPPGEEAVSVSVERGEPVSLGLHYRIEPVQQQYPLSFQGPVQPDPPNPQVYGQNVAFPADLVAHLQTGFYRGHGIASLALNPVTYNPVTGELVYYPRLTVTVESSPSPRATDAFTQMLRQDSETLQKLSARVDNPSGLLQYGGARPPTDDPYFDILLITHEDAVPFWQDYVAWKTRCGFYVAVETVQDIRANYPGVDDPEKMRNCIIDYYQNYDLSYVFLAGDVQLCPYRLLWGSGWLSGIAGDCYFAGLDGNWNRDGDDVWGEADEADLWMEVSVSRALVDSETDIANVTNKQMMYMRQPVVEEVETGLMVGEDLYWNVWGSDYKEEVRTGRSSWGFYTAPFPPNFEVRTLYETPSYSFSGMNDLRPMLNLGLLYVNHMGHAFWDYMLKINDYEVTPENFTNNGINHNFYLVYSQGCLCGGFDNPNMQCITQTFFSMETGPVAMITNSRYGYGNINSTQGSSQYYDKQFFDAIWGENLTLVSEAGEDSKEDCIPYIDYQMNRYCFYEINYFCEPTLDCWTAQPQVLTPSYASEIVLGANSFQVTVPGAAGARVCLSKEGIIHGVGFTDPGGVCNVSITEPLLSVGSADLYVTAHNYLPHEGIVTVIPPSGPYVVYDSLAVDDQQGNQNGIWDYGETTYLDMTITNVGVAQATNVSATISCLDSLVAIADSTAYFGNIAQGASAFVDNAYTVAIPGSVENGAWIPFVLSAGNGLTTWDSYFSLQVSAPDLAFSGLVVNDSTGNQNGSLDPGESAILNVTVLNDGASYTSLLQAALSTTDPYITISTSTIELGTVQPGEEALAAFPVVVAANCPQGHAVDFNVDFSDAVGYTGGDGFSTIVGDLLYLPTGPDAYGYSAYDIYDAPELPVYEWVEICADSGGPGTMIPFTRDDQIAPFPLPFEFRFYGGEYDSLSISTNGYLCMGVVTTDDYSNSGIPNSDGPPAMITAYWEDLSPQRTNSGKVWQWYDAANHLYIVEFNHVEQFSPLDNFETFETILYDPAYYPTLSGDGRIKMQYKSMSPNAQVEGTIGIENPAETIGIQYFYEGAYDQHASPVSDRFAILFTPPTTAPPATITLTPFGAPIQIPATGGSFNYNIAIANSGASQVASEVWCMVTLPGGSTYGPALGPISLILPAGFSNNRDRSQAVPESAPPGNYMYHGYLGDYPNVIYDQDSFPFTKLTTGDGPIVADWSNTGESFSDWMTTIAQTVPDAFALRQNYPNPFNPATTISFTLPAAARAELSVFDIRGRLVVTLVNGWRDAGAYEVTFDGSALASGIYIYRLTAGDFTASDKMVLMK